MNETKIKIKQMSEKVIKFSKIARILCIIGIIGSTIGASACTYIRYSTTAQQYIIEHADIFDGITVNDSSKHLLTFSSDAVSFSENIYDALTQGIENCVEAIIALVLTIILLKFLCRLFAKIIDSDSPFREDLLADIKKIFIIVGILCFSSSIILGIVMVFVLICLFNMFKYGCELQKESDETL